MNQQIRIIDGDGHIFEDGEGIARVLFLARIFEKGREGSFVELSEFAHDGVGWRSRRRSARMRRRPGT